MRIKSIKQINKKTKVYDIQTHTENFFAEGALVHNCFCDALLTSPYGGSCPVRCRMCYVQNGGRGYRSQGITVVDPSYPKKCGTQLDKMKYAFGAYISSFTEPFQPVENVYHITERLSEEFSSRGLPLFYLTRQIPPDWANRYLLKNKHSYMQYSINTNDRVDYKKLSPGVASLDDILAMIREQHKMGIYVSIQINPILSGIVSNEQIISLIHELANNGVNHVIFKFVEIVSPAVPALVREMKKLFPDRVTKFEELFTDTIGGVRTINESYRIRGLQLFKRECQKAGVTMGLCYEYKYERDNGKIVNKTGVSLGKFFCTGAQCHGPEFPLYIKNDKGLFEPFDKCPPCGCLYCEEASEGNIPCGSKFLARATALRPADYNVEVNKLDEKLLEKEIERINK